MSQGQRLHFMDNLRALAMLAGVVFHAALAYSPAMQPYFPTADRAHAPVVDLLVWFPHLFRMPLFFVVAGFFAALLLQRRGMAGLMRNRALRIGLPLLIFLPLVMLSLHHLVLWAAQSLQHPSAMLLAVRGWVQEHGARGPRASTSHLWFLYYLMFFYALLWCVRSLGLGARAAALMGHLGPRRQLLLLPLLLVPAWASVVAPHPAPESLLPQFWAFGSFGLYFAFGVWLHGQGDFLRPYRAALPWLLAASLLLYGLFLVGLGARWSPWVLALLQAYVGAWMTVVCLVAGERLLARASPALRYLADASYWLYLIHLPLLFALQFALMDHDWPWLQKFTLALGGTLLLGLLSYQLLVRHTPLGRLLNGPRPLPPPSEPRSMAA